MAVTVSYDTIRMSEAGDEVTIPLVVQSVRFVAESGNSSTDEVLLVDPNNTSEELWRTFAGSATGVEAELFTSGSRTGRVWPNGVRLHTLTGDNGFVYIRYT